MWGGGKRNGHQHLWVLTQFTARFVCPYNPITVFLAIVED